jgi:hypothetical protein
MVVVPFLRNAGNNPSAVFSAIYILKKKNKKKKKKTKKEEAENSYRMGLWHFTPFLNKRAPN